MKEVGIAAFNAIGKIGVALITCATIAMVLGVRISWTRTQS